MVLPVHDVNPVRRTPWLTYGLIAANVVIFFLTPAAMIGETASQAEICQAEAFYTRYGAIPQELSTNQPLASVPTGEVAAGNGDPACVTGPPEYRKHPLLSVLSSMFLHAGLIHLLGNMLFLWVFGNNIEDRLGRWRYLLFYLFAGYAAAYGFTLADPALTTPAIGASGAVSGILGAYLVIYPRVPVWGVLPALGFIPVRLPAWFVLGLWFVLQGIFAALASSLGGSVAYPAHIAGFLFGVLVGIPLRRRRPPPRRKPPQTALIYRREW